MPPGRAEREVRTLSPRQVPLLQGAVARHGLACPRSVSIPQKSASEKKFFASVVLYDASVPLERAWLKEPFGSHSIDKKRYHEITAHLGWHQKHEHPPRAG